MIVNVPTSVCINGDTIAQDVYDVNGNIILKKNAVINEELKEHLLSLEITDINIRNPICNMKDYEKLKEEMLLNIRIRLSEVIFRKEYKHTKITTYLACMYESIDDNPVIISALNRMKNIDEYTFGHSINTAFYSMFIAIWMGLSNEQIINTTQAGLLHDIGKIYIPSDILNKKGSLTEDEYEMIKKHTLHGYFLLSEFSEFNEEVKRAVLFHHERSDSKGYPLNASPDYTGIISKIIAIADTYDAMTTNRVYKKGISPVEAIYILKDEGMKNLDNEILTKFIENIPLYDFKIKV